MQEEYLLWSSFARTALLVSSFARSLSRAPWPVKMGRFARADLLPDARKSLSAFRIRNLSRRSLNRASKSCSLFFFLFDAPRSDMDHVLSTLRVSGSRAQLMHSSETSRVRFA
ncbi:hypothetical protein PUN28_006980 [Cardiocondyla obscurior]|uniref:Secreted protein n=1 Tax=Cardiocondyla obscurior TaxID=286306 RepID=A0AAW2G105_9HYME